MPSGEGKQTFKTGDIFTGTVAGGKRNGLGMYAFANGDGYQGYFRADKRHGWGQFFYKEQGMFYEGPWEEGLQHGSGFVFTSAASGGVHAGAWERGVQDTETALEPASFKAMAEAKTKFLGQGKTAEQELAEKADDKENDKEL